MDEQTIILFVLAVDWSASPFHIRLFQAWAYSQTSKRYRRNAC